MRRFVLAVAVLLCTTGSAWSGHWKNPGATVTYSGGGYEFRVDIYAYVGSASSFVSSHNFSGPLGGQYGYYNWMIGSSIVTAPGATSVSGEIMRRSTSGTWVDHNTASHDMIWTYVP